MNKNIPTIFVILGATGDLMQKKIAPAFYNLFKKGSLPKMFHVVGFSRDDLTDESFRTKVKEILLVHDNNADQKHMDAFLDLFTYQQGLFEDIKAYESLKQQLQKIDDKWGMCTNKLFYLAVPPQFYQNIFKNLDKSTLSWPCSPKEGWTRIIIEKPFGNNLQTARKLDTMLSTFFKEVQIYRLDHYLAKEALQDVLAFRFLNDFFENNWNNTFIEKMEIRLWEKLGVEKRGSFYDTVGALQDVGQNHLLQMLAIVTMDEVLGIAAEAIRAGRENVLNMLAPLTRDQIKKFTFRAQYQGYKEIAGVAKDSSVETYFKTVAFLNSPRWEGVPIILESGKRLAEQKKEIVVFLKHPSPCLCPKDGQHYQNKIVFSLAPKEGITFDLWRKKPGLNFEIEKRESHLPLRENKVSGQYTEEYEKLLYDCILGDQTLFVSSKEVEAMWRYTDPIVAAWQKNEVPLQTYQVDSYQPMVASEFINKLFVEQKVELKKEIGVVGLGKMGGNLAKRLMQKGWRVSGYNMDAKATDALAKDGLKAEYSLESLVNNLSGPRLVWLMIPAGKPVDEVLFEKNGLASVLKKGDMIIDGGNSFYKDSVARAKKLAAKGIGFMDVGTSGGPAGALNGACLMVGGKEADFKKYEPLFADMALAQGYQFFEGHGAGHFVKMIHNGIEYGMMQAIAEGFAVMKKSNYKLDLTKVANIYNHGSVIESRLIAWLHNAFLVYGKDLKKMSGSVGHTGEGAWTTKTAKEMKVQVKIIEEALKFRIQSEKNPSYTGQILTALRNQFGGHSIEKKK